jgi:hypothetical protein
MIQKRQDELSNSMELITGQISDVLERSNDMIAAQKTKIEGIAEAIRMQNDKYIKLEANIAEVIT